MDDEISYTFTVSPYAGFITTQGTKVDWSNAGAADVGVYVV